MFGIVYIGFGNFYCVYQVWYLYCLMQMGCVYNWVIVGVGVWVGDVVMWDCLLVQDCLIILIELLVEGCVVEIFGVMIDFLLVEEMNVLLIV